MVIGKFSLRIHLISTECDEILYDKFDMAGGNIKRNIPFCSKLKKSMSIAPHFEHLSHSPDPFSASVTPVFNAAGEKSGPLTGAPSSMFRNLRNEEGLMVAGSVLLPRCSASNFDCTEHGITSTRKSII